MHSLIAFTMFHCSLVLASIHVGLQLSIRDWPFISAYRREGACYTLQKRQTYSEFSHTSPLGYECETGEVLGAGLRPHVLVRLSSMPGFAPGEFI